jgi:hypothetical protein
MSEDIVKKIKGGILKENQDDKDNNKQVPLQIDLKQLLSLMLLSNSLLPQDLSINMTVHCWKLSQQP